MQNVVHDQQLLTLASLVYNKLFKGGDLSNQFLIYSITVLDDVAYSHFWSQLSAFSEIPQNTLKTLFQPLQTHYLTTNITSAPTIDFKFRKSVNRKQSAVIIQNKLEFRTNLKAILKRFFNSSFEHYDDKELCEFLNINLKTGDKTEFWSEMGAIQNKTSKQTQDYYHHTFQNALFQNQLSIKDKSDLKNLSCFWKNQTPTFVAKKFMEMNQQEYFKHNVIMYVINLRRSVEQHTQ
ncbi:Hypothetical_protein [Hexamita inflata]|uniref:Hypothetical_protein n=1 Tax=Hexamita inflata TaxID=28002 RepID=A0AA86US36_9EUKA|nr:Hypothetical protein HINF_LOCUS53534 [Hexamita inflata]